MLFTHFGPQSKYYVYTLGPKVGPCVYVCTYTYIYIHTRIHTLSIYIYVYSSQALKQMVFLYLEPWGLAKTYGRSAMVWNL